jgi:hypothetical protein
MFYSYLLISIGICLSIAFVFIILAAIRKEGVMHVVQHDVINAGVVKIGEKTVELEIRIKVLEDKKR